jgi:hypothetical protein
MVHVLMEVPGNTQTYLQGTEIYIKAEAKVQIRKT